MNATTYSTQTAPRAPLPLFPLAMAAALAALAVVAHQVIDAWLGNQLLLAWLALSVVVFTGLWFFSRYLSRLSLQVKTKLSPWIEQRRAAQADARFLALAQQDSRLMADITAALTRHQVKESAAEALSVQTLPAYDAAQARSANIDEEIASARPGYLKLFRV